MERNLMVAGFGGQGVMTLPLNRQAFDLGLKLGREQR